MDNRILSCLAAVIVLSAAFAGAAALAASDPSDAATHPTYGSSTDINIAPGMRYTWTSQWPAGLNPTCSIEKQKQGSLSGSDVSIASVSGKTLTVNIPSNAHAGDQYHVVMKAVTANPSQTAYVYIVFHVVSNLSITVSAANVVAGKNVSIQPSAAGLGTITWSAAGLPAWLHIDASTGKITGTAPGTAQGVSFSVTASSDHGETATKSVSFQVVPALAPTNSPANGIVAMPS